jgi:two-component system chemotaxis response regulator CheB
MANHDIVVIGASAGGIEVLLDLAAELPKSLPASLFVVIHTAPGFASTLPDVLSHRGPLEAVHPVHGARIEAGRIYVAPPDSHLLVRPGRVEVVRGPKENGHRPAVDPLFRSASWAYGPRVVGVVLSGYLDCGTAGMMSVKARGGVAVVQDPATAVAPGMPGSVMARVEVDHVVKPAELPGLLARLAETGAPAQGRRKGANGVPALDAMEGRVTGSPVELVCPDCQGVLTQAEVAGFRRFRCHVGHAFSLESLVDAQSEEVERAMWAAVRSLEEGAALSGRLHRTQGSRELRGRFGEKQRELLEQARVLRGILLRGAERLDEPGFEGKGTRRAPRAEAASTTAPRRGAGAAPRRTGTRASRGSAASRRDGRTRRRGRAPGPPARRSPSSPRATRA